MPDFLNNARDKIQRYGRLRQGNTTGSTPPTGFYGRLTNKAKSVVGQKLQGATQNEAGTLIGQDGNPMNRLAPTQYKPPAKPTQPQNNLAVTQPQNNLAVTDVGDIYAQNVRKGLTEVDPRIASERNSAAARQSAREYAARLTAREQSAMAGHGAGTAQASRMLTEQLAPAYTAGVQERQGINESQRQYFQDAMNKAKGLDDTAWTRTNTEKVQDQTSAQLYLNNIQDPVTKAHMTSVYANEGLGGLQRAMGNFDSMPKSDEPWKQEVKGIEGRVRHMIAPEGEQPYVDPATGELTPNGQSKVSELLDMSTRNALDPTGEGDKNRKIQQGIDDRVGTYLETGSTEGMTPDDWKAILKDPNKMSEVMKTVQDAEVVNTHEEWGNDSKLSDDAAIKKYQEANPWAQPGTVMMYEGEFYEIIEIKEKKADKGWNQSQRYRVGAYAKPLSGSGSPKFITGSSRYYHP